MTYQTIWSSLSKLLAVYHAVKYSLISLEDLYYTYFERCGYRTPCIHVVLCRVSSGSIEKYTFTECNGQVFLL